jgi:hypothetical protein
MHRSPSSLALLVPLAFAAACTSDMSSVVAPATGRPGLSVGGGGCAFADVTSGVLPPINADNSSVFQLGRTIPVKIRVTDCLTGAAVDNLAPQVALGFIGAGGEAVNELVSSSAADVGTAMRNAGDGQYIFNLSTKKSQFNLGQDLTVGSYQLTLSSLAFADVVVTFALR